MARPGRPAKGCRILAFGEPLLLLRRDGRVRRRADRLTAQPCVPPMRHHRTDQGPIDIDLVEIACASSSATLCLTSALARHDLTDDIPAALDVAVARDDRRPATRAPVRWHRFARDTFDLGRDLLVVHEPVRIGLYSAERSIVDAYRLRHLEGDELGRQALRRWLARPGAHPATLMDLAGHFPKAEPRLRADLELLL